MGRWLVVVLLCTTACLRAQSIQCGDAVCARDTVCVAALDLCADPKQVAACEMAADGDRCVTTDILVGTCTSGACISSGCGNGLIESGEACDDGNTRSGDGCSADCTSSEVCGNGIVDHGEQCDCGDAAHPSATCSPNSDLGGPCNTHCILRCGDGIVSPDEACDPGIPKPVSCAGAEFDRGLTTCDFSCKPVISIDTCRYIGWRTRAMGSLITDVAPTTSVDRGFYITGTMVYTLSNYLGTLAFTAPTTLTAVWAQDDDNAFAVGLQGWVTHWNGGWANARVGTADLHDVWGRTSDDVYAMGDTTVWHWDGARWSPLNPPTPGTFRALGGDASHLYVAGDNGTLLAYDGSNWQIIAATAANLHSVWAAPGIAVAVGDGGTIVQNLGSGWVTGRVKTHADLHGVWGDGLPASDRLGFFAVGDAGTIVFFDGRVWRPMALGKGVTSAVDDAYTGITGVANQGVGVGGSGDIITYEGAAWSPNDGLTGETIYGLWASATDDIFAVGRNGTILHSDGLGWSTQASGVDVDLRSVWGTGPDDVFATGDNSTLLHYDGARWTTYVTSGSQDFLAVFVGDAPLVATLSGVARYDGDGSFTTVDSRAERALWGTGAQSIWAGGNSGIRHFDGAGWTMTTVTDPTFAIAGIATDVYTVGAASNQLHGAAWSSGPFEGTLTAVTALASDHVFAGGPSGVLLHWNGAALEPLVGRTTTDLNALFAVGNLVIIAGTDGALDTLIFHQ